MPPLATILLWTQITTAILLIIVIILQQKSAGLGAAMGGGGEHFASHRGLDKLLTIATILFAIIFFGTALAYLFV